MCARTFLYDIIFIISKIITNVNMKKLYFTLVFLFVSFVVFSQNNFTNNGGDFKWSNAANWSGSVPNAASTKVVIKSDNVIVDGNYKVAQITFPSAGAGGEKIITFTNESNGILTITGKGVSQPIKIVRNPQSAIFNLPVIFDASESSTETFYFANKNQKITFGSGHSLTVKDDITFTAKEATTEIHFDGSTSGVGDLKFGTKSDVYFGSTYDGSSHTGTLIVAGGTGNAVTLTSNVAKDGTFLKSGGSLQVTKPAGIIHINGENTFKGNIELTAANGVKLNMNANQSAMGTITMGSGTLNLVLSSAVTDLAFADSSAKTWDAGKLAITGAQNDEVSFGTSAAGLTVAQLNLIDFNGSVPVINASGEISAASVLVSSFNGGGGDNLWSTAANWSAGIPTGDTAKVTINADLVVDSNKTVAQIQNNGSASAASVTITATGGSVLTITGEGGVSQPIKNNKSGSSFIFNLPVVFDSTSGTKTLMLNGGGDQKITFSSSLTLNDPITIKGSTNKHALNIDGSLLGSGNLTFGLKTQAAFGANYDGSSYAGTLVVAGGTGNAVTLTSNVAKDGTFLKSGGSLQVTKPAGIIHINGENTFKGNIELTAANNVTLNVNADQSAMGTVTIGSGTLNLALANNVSSAVFADSSAKTWDADGTLAITGAQDNEVGFGTSASGVTATQLTQFTIGGGVAAINASGKISALSILVSSFNGGGGDNLWSNAANWSAGIPTGDTAKVTINADLVVDSNKTVAQIQNNGSASAASVTITATGGSVLTITGEGGVSQPIKNNKSGSSFIFNLPVVFDSTSGTKLFRLNSGNNQNITFSSSLTLNDPISITGNDINHAFNIDGSLLGSGNLTFGLKAQATFGANYDGSSYDGEIIASHNQVRIVSNVADDGTFLKSGGLLNVTKSLSKITVNGANTLKGNINIGDFNPTLIINKNQSAMGTITMGIGTLNLELATAVTSAVFADNSSAVWGTGKVIITGAFDNEVGFGINASGVTATQLAQITIGGGGAAINASGKISAKEIKSSTFNSAGVDNLWSNPANWSAGIPNVPSAKVTLNSSLVIDTNVELAQIKLAGNNTSVVVTAKNNSTLTINAEGVTQPIQNNAKDADFKLDLPIVFTFSDIKTVNANAAGTCSISFGENSNLTLSAITKFSAIDSRSVNMNGILQGPGQFQLAGKSTATFGSTSDNSSFTGGFKMLGNNSSLIVDTAANGTFLKSGTNISPDTDSTGHSVSINKENVLKGNIVIFNNSFSIGINSNQSAVGTLTMQKGTLDLSLNSDQTSIAFVDNSTLYWGTGKLVLTDAGVDKVSFGNSETGLTPSQLNQITMDGSFAKINSSGYINTFSLSTNNNKVQVTNATCIGTNDGSILISVEDASYDYSISVTGPRITNYIDIKGANDSHTLTSLSKGTYTLCFKVDGQANYEQCFEAVVGEPAVLSAFVDVDNDDKTTSISLGGSDSYNIDINGIRYQVKGNSFDANLPTGLSTIRISTDLECQGIIEKEIFISEDILYYPNPTKRDVKVHVSGKDTKVMVSVFSEKGDLIYRKEQEIQDMSRLTDIDLSRQITGNYIVVMESKTVRKTFKIIKR